MLRRVTVARAGSEGSLASAPVPVTFSGSPGASVVTRTRVVSDPVSFPVHFGEELAVSFEVESALAASAIELLPGSAMRPDSWATTPGPLGGTSWAFPVGLATVEVEGPPSRAFVALGDSITEGYIDGHDDIRDIWAFRAGAQLGVPIVNAGVSGQGFYDGLRMLDGEALVLSGITDCIVLLGTSEPVGDERVDSHPPAAGHHRLRGGDTRAGQRAPLHRRAGRGRHPPERRRPSRHGQAQPGASSSGSDTVKRAPCPGWLSTDTLPPCASTISRRM